MVAVSVGPRYLTNGTLPMAGGTGTWATATVAQLNSDNAAYAVWTKPSGTGQTSPGLECYGFDFSDVPDQGAGTVDVKMEVNAFVSSTTRQAAFTYELWNGTTARIGNAFTGNNVTSSGNIDTTTWTAVPYSQLATLRLRVYGHGGSSSTSGTSSVDYVRLTVTYQAPDGLKIIAFTDDVECRSSASTRYPAVMTAILSISPDEIWHGGDTIGTYAITDYYGSAWSLDATWMAQAGVPAKFYPVPGNHDFDFSPTGNPGFDTYFQGTVAPNRTDIAGGQLMVAQGHRYYAHDLVAGATTYRIYHLSNAVDSGSGAVDSCAVGSAQYNWLSADLDAALAAGKPIIAVCHLPRWSCFSSHPSTEAVTYHSKELYDLIYDHHGDLFLSGHVHGYARFPLMDKNGAADANGVRQICGPTASQYGNGDYSAASAPLAPDFYRTDAGSYDNQMGFVRIDLFEDHYDLRYYVTPVAGGLILTDSVLGTLVHNQPASGSNATGAVNQKKMTVSGSGAGFSDVSGGATQKKMRVAGSAAGFSDVSGGVRQKKMGIAASGTKVSTVSGGITQKKMRVIAAGAGFADISGGPRQKKMGVSGTLTAVSVATGAITQKKMGVSGTGAGFSDVTGAVRQKKMTVAGTGAPPGEESTATGAVTQKKMIVAGTGTKVSDVAGAVTQKKMQVSGAGEGISVASGGLIRKKMSVAAAGAGITVAAGGSKQKKMTVSGAGTKVQILSGGVTRKKMGVAGSGAGISVVSGGPKQKKMGVAGTGTGITIGTGSVRQKKMQILGIEGDISLLSGGPLQKKMGISGSGQGFADVSGGPVLKKMRVAGTGAGISIASGGSSQRKMRVSGTGTVIIGVSGGVILKQKVIAGAGEGTSDASGAVVAKKQRVQGASVKIVVADDMFVFSML